MRLLRPFALTLGAALLAGASARADTIHHPTAVFAGLDKITGRIITFDVATDETVQFGTLQITPRVCLTRPQTEAPLTEGFVEVDEIDAARTAKRIFSGWMFAASPGLHGVEHPVYDVWLKDCKGGVEVTASPVNAQPDKGKPPPPNASAPPAPGAPANKPHRTIEPQEPVEPGVESLPPSDVDAMPPPGAPDNGVNGANGAPAGGLNAPAGGLGAPIEIGPAPGAGRPGGDAANPSLDPGAPLDAGVAPPAAAKPPKPKRKPPTDPNAAPGGAASGAPVPPAPVPPAPVPQSAPLPQRQQPSGPQDIIKNLPFFR